MHCTNEVKVDFDKILADTPEGKIAMFEVTAIPSGMDDYWLEAFVLVNKQGTFIDPMTRKFVQTPDSVRFIKYVNKDWS